MLVWLSGLVVPAELELGRRLLGHLGAGILLRRRRSLLPTVRRVDRADTAPIRDLYGRNVPARRRL